MRQMTPEARRNLAGKIWAVVVLLMAVVFVVLTRHEWNQIDLAARGAAVGVAWWVFGTVRVASIAAYVASIVSQWRGKAWEWTVTVCALLLGNAAFGTQSVPGDVVGPMVFWGGTVVCPVFAALAIWDEVRKERKRADGSNE